MIMIFIVIIQWKGIIMDPYAQLEIAPGASEEEVRRAHRALAARWHPDRFPDGPERMWAEQKRIAINNAYNDALRQAQGDRVLEILAECEREKSNGDE